MSEYHYLACDLGAESGRIMAGTLTHGKLSLREIHRFANVPLRTGTSLRWQFTKILGEIEAGLRKAAGEGTHYASVSSDSWGVDYVLFDASDKLVEPVYHYRDARTAEGVKRVFNTVDWTAVFEETGIQFMPINTLFQLATEEPARLREAKFLLGVGDAVNYFLSGVPRLEVSMASTFQLYNPRTRGWSEKLIQAHGFPRSLFPELAESATILGPLRQDLGLEGTSVIATCSHDTGAAVAGVPAVDNENWAYLSSGTWSLMGVELDAPIINNSAREMNFTNEIGYGNRVRFLKNLSGLWLVQECRRAWAEQGEQWEYARLAELARDAAPFRSLIDPAAPEFLAPASMPAQIASFCRRTGQPEVRRPGEFVRCILESLALLYRHTLRQLEELIGRRIGVMHIVGGGSNNDLLNQFTANALGVAVLVGPAEATAAGNIVLQAIALGHLSSLEAAREVIRNSCTLRRFEPREAADWDRGYRQFMQVRELDSARRGDPETSEEPA